MLHLSKRTRSFSPDTAKSLLEDNTELNKPFALDTKRPRATKDPENIDPLFDVDMSISTPAPEQKQSRPYERMKGLVIEVEGNIGSGKSTLTENLKKLANQVNDESFSRVFGEQVNNTFLGAFYGNAKRFGFAFQMYMLTTRIYQMDEASRQAKDEQRLVFLDRGAVGDTLFAVQNYTMKNMDDEEMRVYRSVCRERLPSSLSSKVDCVLYLDVEPTECHRRMSLLRKREAEEGIPLSYLEGLDSCYFHLLVNWLGDREDGLHDMNIGGAPPMLIVQWTKFGTTEDVMAELDKLQAGERKSPSVRFQAEKPRFSDEALLLDTEEDVASAYELFKSTGSPASPSTVATLHLNWDLEHSNSFKRVSMHFLSLGARVVFYGAGTQSRDSTALSMAAEKQA